MFLSGHCWDKVCDFSSLEVTASFYSSSHLYFVLQPLVAKRSAAEATNYIVLALKIKIS